MLSIYVCCSNMVGKNVNQVLECVVHHGEEILYSTFFRAGDKDLCAHLKCDKIENILAVMSLNINNTCFLKCGSTPKK